MNTKRIRSLSTRGMFLICIIFCSLVGCKKELPPASVGKSEQAKVKKGIESLG